MFPRLPMLFFGLLFGCASRPSQPSARLSLPEDWQTQGPWDFEQALLPMPLGLWCEADRVQLAGVLEDSSAASIRAAVLLAHGAQPSAEVLLAELEARRAQPERHADAAEIVAAAALVRWGGESIAGRLTALAVGSDPHPDLEVRVECASGALDLGQRAVVPFLLRILHALTPLEREDPIDWTPTDKLAWAKGRAAAALSRAAGQPQRFRADGSWEHQMQAARALEAALAIRP